MRSFMHDLLDEAVVANPDGRAIQDEQGTWSYRQLVGNSLAFAKWLQLQGVGRGDRVVVRLPNCRDTAAILYAASRCGAVFVPINPAMKQFHLRSVLADCTPALVVAADAEADALRALSPVPVHGVEAVRAEVAGLAGARPEPVEQAGQDLAMLIYTSGSTAAPKAVVCPHAQVVFAAGAVEDVLGYRDTDVVFCRLPLSFDYGLYQLLLAALAGAQVVLAADGPDFLLLKQMRECGATVVPVVPSLGAMICSLATRDPGGTPPVRMFTNTGAALPDATISALYEAFPGCEVIRMFGTTECKRITVMPPDQHRERPGAVGRALPGTEVLILDERDQPLPAGETGQIVVSGPHVMAGYWRSPELTARTFRPGPDGTRLHTGDYGRLDEDGYLYFAGRRDDLFKRKGARMSTVEIEAAAMDIPGVRAAVVLAPTEHRDLAICVASDLAPHEVLRELAQRLEPTKVPSVCQVFDELPLTANGKNERKELAVLLDGGAR